MKLQKLVLSLVGLFVFPFFAHGTVMEVGVAIQDATLTWFDISNPSIQGTISATGIPSTLTGNALAYDPLQNSLLFTDSQPATSHTLYSVSLTGLNLVPGGNVSAGAATNLGSINFVNPQGLFGAAFYNGSYYTIKQDTNGLVKVDFNGSGNISTQTGITLPSAGVNNNKMNLGDLAFDTSGNLWISGDNVHATPSHAANRLWEFSTANGTTFAFDKSLNPAGLRWNGLGFDLAGDLFGYRLGSGEFGTIDESNGNFTTIYTGSPFLGGGDLTSSFTANVTTPPPPVPDQGSSVVLLLVSSLVLFTLRIKYLSPAPAI